MSRPSDRVKARDLAESVAISTAGGFDISRNIDEIAAALVEERAKARAPFLALADEYDRHTALMRAVVIQAQIGGDQ